MTSRLSLRALSLAALLFASTLAQNQVPIEFQTDPLIVQTGTEIVFTVSTISDALSIRWTYQGGINLGLWSSGSATVSTAPQFLGRVTITATSLRIGNAQLQDAGQYTVTVVPISGTPETSKSAQLRVFDPLIGLSMFVPSTPVEGRNVSLACTWTSGTEITVQWGKDGTTITADSRIIISGGSLVINPSRRSDTGEYTCTASNPVSAANVRRSITVFYGPDTPVLTLESPKDCVGEGDVKLGETVLFTCISESLPPALYSWQLDGQTIAQSEPDIGLLSVTTISTDQNGLYTCVARNSITEGTSEQTRELVIVDVCFSGGEVAGIVIGAFLALLILILLIILIVVLVRRRRVQQRQRDTVQVPKTNPPPRVEPPETQPDVVRDVGQQLNRGPNPPLFYTHTRSRDRLSAGSQVRRSDPQILTLNGLHNSDTRRPNRRTDTNRQQQTLVQNTNSNPLNGIDNPVFSGAQNANPQPSTQQQNPQQNIVIQTGNGQGGAQQPAVQLSLNTLPQNSQPSNNAQMPTIHVNLNSYPNNGQQTQQDGFLPLNSAANNASPLNQPNLMQTGQPLQSQPSFPSVPQHNAHGITEPVGSIPTGFTHFNPNIIPQQNANTQTYEQNPGHDRWPNRSSKRTETTPGSSLEQMPWDRLRGTPAYPNDPPRRAHMSPDDSDTTDYTIHPPIREGRPPDKAEPHRRNASRGRTPPRGRDQSPDRQIWNRVAELRRANVSNIVQLEPSHHTQGHSNTQRETVRADRSLSGNQTALRQEATSSNNPQALPLISQQASVGSAGVSQGPIVQQGLTALQGVDTRALADPNHLQQALMAQQQRQAQIQTVPQNLTIQIQPVIQGASQPRQVSTAAAPFPPNQPNPSNLTQDALRAHTERAQIFQNRREQTQAALLNPGTQSRAVGGRTHQPPPPPPVIPLTQFQTLPRDRTQNRSPTRGPQPLRPPVNLPVAQRPIQLEQRPNHHHHHHHQHHHHRPGNGHKHGHTNAHGHPAHFTQQPQQQAHRGRPRW